MRTCVLLGIFTSEYVIVIPLFALSLRVYLRNVVKLVRIFRTRGYETLNVNARSYYQSTKRIMFIVDRFNLVSIEPYKNQCLDKQTCVAISLSISKHIFC